MWGALGGEDFEEFIFPHSAKFLHELENCSVLTSEFILKRSEFIFNIYLRF